MSVILESYWRTLRGALLKLSLHHHDRPLPRRGMLKSSIRIITPGVLSLRLPLPFTPTFSKQMQHLRPLSPLLLCSRQLRANKKPQDSEYFQELIATVKFIFFEHHGSIWKNYIPLPRSVAGPTGHLVHCRVINKPFVRILHRGLVTPCLLPFRLREWCPTYGLRACGGSHYSARRRHWNHRASFGGSGSAS